MTTPPRWPPHPAAELFPMLAPDDLADLADDIAANGLREPVWLWDDPERGTVLLDGRNRLAACQAAGVPCVTRRYDGGDPVGFVLSMNLKRRHLTPGQRALLALDVEKLYAAEAAEQISAARRAAVAQRADRRARAEQARANREPVPGLPGFLYPPDGDDKTAIDRAARDEDHVYFALSADGQQVKIGKSWNPRVRVEDLLRANPGLTLLGSIPGSFDIETALHKRFRGHRLTGEWFAYPPISDAIDALLQKCHGGTFVTVADVAEPVDTLARAGAQVDASRRTMARAKFVALAAPDLADRVRDGKLELARAERIIRDRDAEQRRIAQARADAAALAVPVRAEVRLGDFRDVLADLRDVDAVITDPPYGREFLPLLADLAGWADKVLTPGGVLAVLIGGMYLPDVYRLLGGFRPYRWTACYLTPGPGDVLYTPRVQSNWKPLIIYGGGPRFADVFRSEGSDAAAKDYHRWGQDYAGFHEIVSRLTSGGQTVADPFAGGGTTLLAAKALGRHSVGADTDPAAVATARGRLS